MTIDLSQAKAGNTVHFRCGGSSSLLHINYALDGVWKIRLKGDNFGVLKYKKNGMSKVHREFDIVSITNE